MSNMRFEKRKCFAARYAADFSCVAAQNASQHYPRNLLSQRAEGTLPRLEKKGE
jgi:hypothetical protein